MPVLYERLGIPGRVLSSLFFLCLSLGGVSSLVAMIELPVHTLEEMRGALLCVIFESLAHTRGHVSGTRSKDSAVLVYACAYDACCRRSTQSGANKRDVSSCLCGSGGNLQEQCTR